jgi:hypothetical protein
MLKKTAHLEVPGGPEPVSSHCCNLPAETEIIKGKQALIDPGAM